METTVLVEGMMCTNCEKHVKEALEKLDGILEAVPDHTTGRVRIRHNAPLDEGALKAAVEAEDYVWAGLEK